MGKCATSAAGIQMQNYIRLRVGRHNGASGAREVKEARITDRPLLREGAGNADVLVGAAVVEQPSRTAPHQSLYEDDIGDLAHFLPGFNWEKNGFIGASQHLGRIVL